MTITSIRPMGGELPPGTVDGYCIPCAGDTIVSAPDYACPACQTPVHLDSLPRDARLAMMRGQGVQAGQTAPDAVDVAVETIRPAAVRNGAAVTPPAVKTIMLPSSRAAVLWDRATDQLVAAADAEEAAAKAEYETAKARYQAARQQAHTIRQLRQIATVEGAGIVAKLAPAKNGKWARDFDACVNCGSTNYKHGSRGYCKRGACEKAAKASREAQP